MIVHSLPFYSTILHCRGLSTTYSLLTNQLRVFPLGHWASEMLKRAMACPERQRSSNLFTGIQMRMVQFELSDGWPYPSILICIYIYIHTIVYTYMWVSILISNSWSIYPSPYQSPYPYPSIFLNTHHKFSYTLYSYIYIVRVGLAHLPIII